MLQSTPPTTSWHLKAVRGIYIACMIIGLPLWLLALILFSAFVRFIVAGWFSNGFGIRDFPDSYEGWGFMFSGLAFILVYPATFFFSHHVTRRPWTVFASMLLPVSALACFFAFDPSFTDSNEEQTHYLLCLASFAGPLLTGCIMAMWAEQKETSAEQRLR